jgi:hypothetical protein
MKYVAIGQANNMDWRKMTFLSRYIAERQVGRRNICWDNTTVDRGIDMN